MAAPSTRERIREFVDRHPASSARAIQRGLGLGWGETAYHLRRLTRDGLLLLERGGRRDYFFGPETPASDRSVLIAFESPAQRAILVGLAGESPRSFADLSKELPVARSTAAFHLRWLLAAGLVEAVGTGSSRGYRARNGARVAALARRSRPPEAPRWSDRFSETWGGLVRE